VRGDVRLVQGGRVQHGLDAGHAAPYECGVGDGADRVRVVGRQHVEADRFVSALAQHAHQGFAEVPGAAGDEDPHGCGIELSASITD
jgi:hypothetical protein